MGTETVGDISTVEELSARYPGLVQKIKDDAAREATDAENGRLKAIDEISGQISDGMVREAKYGEKRMTAEALALEAFRKNGVIAAAALSGLKEDIGNSGADGVGADANSGLADGPEGMDHDAKVQNLAKKFKRGK